MKLNNTDWFSELAMILGHSVWIGILLPLIYFLYIKPSPRFSPSARVTWGLLLMFLVPLFSVFFALVDFWLPAILNYRFVIPYSVIVAISGLWLLGVGALAIRMLLGMFFVSQLKRSGKAVPQHASPKIGQIRQQLKIPASLEIMVAADSPGPLLCGISRPAILLPEPSINQSKTDRIASILAHETAHYLRKDIFFNLVQCVLEVICFFHPGVRWMSREIRFEREKACDDLAVEMLEGKRLTYAAALLEAEYQTKVSFPAAAFGVESTSDRAVRIAFGEKQERLPYSGVLSAVSTVTILLIGLSIMSVVKVSTHAPQIPQFEPVPEVIFEPITISPEILKKKLEWRDKVIGGRAVPMLKSVPLIERNGILYDPAKPTPQLFDSIPNRWLLDHELNLLDHQLPTTDPDGDHFTVLEEYQAGTDPNDSNSHPGLERLLSCTGRHFQLYRVSYVARTDENTVQLIRHATNKFPTKLSYFLKQGEVSPDGRLMLKEIGANSVVIEDRESHQSATVNKGAVFDFKVYYAELQRRGSESFFVKEGTGFYIPGDDKNKWQLVQVSETEAKIGSGSGTIRILPIKEKR